MNALTNHLKSFRIGGLSNAISLLICLAFAMLMVASYFVAGAEGVMMANAVGVVTLESLGAELKQAVAEVKSTGDELKLAQAELKERYKTDGQVPEEVKRQIDELLTKFNGLKASNDEIEQKLATKLRHEQKNAPSWGEQIVDSQSYKDNGARLANSSGRIHTEIKSVNTTAVAGMIRSQRESGIVRLPTERFVMRDLLPTIPTDSNAIEYVKQTTRTNNAGPVAESAAASYSDFAYANATANVRRIAHLAKLTRQAISDAPRLVGEINIEMRYGLGYKEERQFLYGSGVGENINGIITQATAFARPAGVGQMANVTRLDSLRMVFLQLAVALMPADGVVLNPVDWALIETLKDSQGRYLVGDPNGASLGKKLWGVPVVDTPAIDAGDFLAGNFGIGATVYDRQTVEIEISTENADDFEKYLATMSAAERVALAVKRPGAFVTGDFAAAETALEAA